MRIPQRIQSMASSPIDVINAHANQLRNRGIGIVNLGQAIPNFSPVNGALDAAREALDEPSTHVYSPDAGLLSLREKLSRILAQHNNIIADPETEILITAGANQAFMLALLTLIEPGDKVLLPAPFFFNHQMAVRIAGGVPVEIPLMEETGFQLRLEDLKPYLDLCPRILVIVSPNNPTGAVYAPQELKRIGFAAAQQDIVIITDEAYSDFVYQEAEHFSLASIAAIGSQVITIGSFSKTFSMTGWRVGFLVAESTFIEEALKVQDSMLICATVIAQKAALRALETPVEEIARRRDILNQRRRFLIERLAEIPQLRWTPTCGGFFAFVRNQGCSDSVQLAMEILDRVHVITIPGSAFGEQGQEYLRLSYGSVNLPDLDEACHRLSRFFAAV